MKVCIVMAVMPRTSGVNTKWERVVVNYHTLNKMCSGSSGHVGCAPTEVEGPCGWGEDARH